jgi:hypothetical protein
MPKVVTGKGFDEFVQTGKHQTIDGGSKRPEPKVIEKPPEVKELIKETEAKTALDMKPDEGKEDTGLEAGDEEFTERTRKRIETKHREMKQAQALADKLKGELEDTENFSKSQYQRALAAEESAKALEYELGQLRTNATKAEAGNELQAPDENDPKFRNDKGEFQLKLYEAARDKYVLAQFKQQQEAERVQADQALKIKAFEAKLERAREKYPDFKEIVGAADVQVPPYIQNYMVESDFGGDLGYFFAKNPEVTARIFKLPPIKAIAEIGKLEVQWEKKPEEPKPAVVEIPKPSGGAPPPITPWKGTGSPGVNSDPAKMSPKELLAYTREKEVSRKRR